MAVITCTGYTSKACSTAITPATVTKNPRYFQKSLKYHIHAFAIQRNTGIYIFITTYTSYHACIHFVKFIHRLLDPNKPGL